MKLRNKILWIVLVFWCVFFIISLIGTRFLLVNNLYKLEDQQASQSVEQVNQALLQKLNNQSSFTTDWSHWDDAYNFLQGKNPNFFDINIKPIVFENAKINFLMYFNSEGKLIAGAAYDFNANKFMPYPAGLMQSLASYSTLFQHKNANQTTQGFINLPSGLMLVAASPVTNGNASVPSNGTLITGRYLSADLINEIANITKLPIHLFLPNQINSKLYLINVYQKLTTSKAMPIKKIDANKMAGFQLIQDIKQQPIGLIEIIIPRTLFKAGIDTIQYYLILNLLRGLTAIIVIWIVINLLITKRLRKLERQVVKIGQENVLSERIQLGGNDELTSTANTINHLLDVIENHQAELENRVAERTAQLKYANEQLTAEINERKNTENELIKHKEHLAYLAHYDNLTGLPNRTHFNTVLNKTISTAKRYKRTFAILFVDLDRFKHINDVFGHSTGDQVLKLAGARLKNVLRDDNTVARLGGDEFIILLNEIKKAEEASRVAERLISALAKPFHLEGREFYLNASIGISIYPDDGNSLEILHKNSDIAMYHAKRMGGNNYCYYNPEMDRIAHKRLELETGLRKAIANGELTLFYQPKIDLKTQKIIGVEALARWNHPQLGNINPMDFIPIAEETGLILSIGEWVLREACATTRKWIAQGCPVIPIAVNLSPIQFRDQFLVEVVKQILEETKLDPHLLELEITETAVMTEMSSIVTHLKALTALGITIAIDDFGTGYTSIAYLKQFPISIIKIDQSFIKGIPDSDDDTIITHAIIKLAHNLGLKVIAEGIETVEQLNYLVACECDMVQGYFFSPPVSAEMMVEQLRG